MAPCAGKCTAEPAAWCCTQGPRLGIVVIVAAMHGKGIKNDCCVSAAPHPWVAQERLRHRHRPPDALPEVAARARRRPPQVQPRRHKPWHGAARPGRASLGWGLHSCAWVASGNTWEPSTGCVRDAACVTCMHACCHALWVGSCVPMCGKLSNGQMLPAFQVCSNLSTNDPAALQNPSKRRPQAFDHLGQQDTDRPLLSQSFTWPQMRKI